MQFKTLRNQAARSAGLAMALLWSWTISAAESSKASPANDQPPSLTADSGLQDYLRYAALEHAGLRAAFHRWNAKLEQIAQARSLPDPKLNYGYFIQEVETRVGPQRHRVGLAQMFPWFGKLKLRGEMAARDAEAAFQEYEMARLKLFQQVKDAWFELYYLHRATTITEENIRLLSNLESVAQTKYKTGGPLTGVVKSQVELGKLTDRLRTLRDLRAPLAARLNAALNRPPDAPIHAPTRLAPQAVDLHEADLAEWLKENNPRLKELDSRVAREDSAMALARKEYLPDITLGLDYIETGDARMAGVQDSGKDPLIATLSLNIPLWTRKYRAGVREAHERREAYTESRVQELNTLLSEVTLAAYRFRDAERKIQLYARTLRPLAEKSLSVAQQSWEAGQADFLELIDAQRLLLEFQLEEERARANREQRLAELEMLVGRELSSAPEPDAATSDTSPLSEEQP